MSTCIQPPSTGEGGARDSWSSGSGEGPLGRRRTMNFCGNTFLSPAPVALEVGVEDQPLPGGVVPGWGGERGIMWSVG